MLGCAAASAQVRDGMKPLSFAMQAAEAACFDAGAYMISCQEAFRDAAFSMPTRVRCGPRRRHYFHDFAADDAARESYRASCASYAH